MHQQNKVSISIGLVLLARGFLGFLMNPAPLFGVLSTTMNHNFMHILFGLAYVWVSRWSPKPSTACAWNKFLGWCYAGIAIMGIINIGLLSSNNFYGVNSLGDNIFNICIAIWSLSCAYDYYRVERGGVSFMRALNFPFGKS